MRTTLTSFVPAHKQPNPAHKPGQIVNPLGMTIQSSEKTLGEYIRRKNSQAAFDAIAQERRYGWCGNPLRGCMDCPPQEEISFVEWFKQRTLEFDSDSVITFRDVEIIAQEAWERSKGNL